MRETYVPNLKAPSRKKPSYRMWLTLLLCVALPPVGLALLWGRVRCPLRGKVWISLVGVTVLVVELTLFLNWQEKASYVAPQVPIVYTYGDTSPSSPESTSMPELDSAPDQTVTNGTENGTEDPGTAIIPSNPMG